MARHRAVCRLVLVGAVRGDEYARHQAQAAERRGHHVAHHVAVIVLACPDETALGAHHARHGVVDQSVEIFDAGFLKLFFIVSVVNFLENILEAVIVNLRNGVFRGKPQVLLRVERIAEAGVRKAGNAAVQIVLALHHARAFEFLDCLARLRAVRRSDHEFRLAACRHRAFHIAVHVAVSMTGQRDGLFPVRHKGNDTLHQDWRAEHGAVQNGADRAVRGFPHLMQVVFLHAGSVRGDGRAFHGDAVFFCGLGALHCDAVACLVAVLEPQIIVFRLQIHVRQDEDLLEHLPDDARHLVAVHLHERRLHLQLFHFNTSKTAAVSPGRRFHVCNSAGRRPAPSRAGDPKARLWPGWFCPSSCQPPSRRNRSQSPRGCSAAPARPSDR